MAIKMLILTLKIRHVKSTCNFLRLLREKKKQAAIAPFDLDLTKIKGMRTP